MTTHVIRGDALALPLADASVDLICTSPPYFGLRSYQDDGQHYAGQIGSEATPAEFVDALIAATREMMRVLKPSGSIWVNLGDKYAGAPAGPRSSLPQQGKSQTAAYKDGRLGRSSYGGIPNKSLLGIPWRYALRCIDDLGLILRAEIIWAKPNGLPESVTDRVRRSHETWFHLVKQPRYYSAVDEIREEHEAPRRDAWDRRPERVNGIRPTGSVDARVGNNPLGKLPGSVWTIPTQPLTVPPELGVDHFAAFPMEWPRRIIQGWSPAGVCTACGEGRRPVQGVDWDKVPHSLELQRNRSHTESDRRRFGELFSQWQDAQGIPNRDIAALFPSATGGLTGCVSNWRSGANVLMPDQRDVLEERWGCLPDELRDLIGEMAMLPVALFKVAVVPGAMRHRNKEPATRPEGYRSITGYACGCPEPTAPTQPGVILDPFGGTGTTALVAKALGRTGISVDMSADYCRLAAWRCTDPGQMAAALQVEKPEPVSPDQLDLFSEVPA